MKNTSLIVFVLYCCFVNVAYSLSSFIDTNKCKKRTGNFPKPGSLCRSYYSCKNWIPLELECPRDEHFSPSKGFCVQPEMYPCFEKPKHKECPTPNGLFLRPDTGCKEYYKCCDGVPTKKTCSGGLLFSQDRGVCDWDELVVCPDEVKEFKECPFPNGLFLKPNSGCKEYYDCNNGVPTKKTCSSNLLFNQKENSCDWSELVNCPDNDQCNTNPCRNNGTCSISNGKVTCDCKDPFVGERCEKNQCHPNPCNNNGICSTINKEVKCSCRDPFVGKRCEKNMCKPNPCQNNGTCNMTKEKVTCSCKDPFIGERCEKDQCHPNPCHNHGACSVIYGKVTCSCQEPFIGERCEKNQCQPNPCHNNGTCSILNGKVTCLCHKPFIGERCEKNQCDPNPCRNNGTCSVLNGKVNCSCYEPFIGERCEKNQCDPNPCHNNGTCSVLNGKVTCSCYEPFIGEKCEKNQCDLNPCHNNGTCTVLNEKVICSCLDPFVGEKCEKNQCNPNPCQNNGRCITVNGKITCSCRDPFSGDRCEKNIHTTPTLVTANIFCPEPNGHFPHPNDKHKFVACLDSNPTVLECPSNLVYNHKKRYCDYNYV